MKTIFDQSVVSVATEKLHKNELLSSIYLIPENYDVIKNNIKEFGLLTPLLVDENYCVISGNLRLQIAIDLKMGEVPVVFVSTPTEKSDVIALATNQFRKKSCIEILREIDFYAKYYSIKPGVRTDINPELKLAKQEKDLAYKELGTYKVRKLKSIQTLGAQLYGYDSAKVDELLLKVDKGALTLNKVEERLNNEIIKKTNNEVVPKVYDFITEKVKIYNHTCEVMYELENSSINTIVVSPPYFGMFDYGTGKTQLGFEKDVEEFVDKLVIIFKEAYRVLKEDGSLFVNLNDCVREGQYQCVPELFLIKMIQTGLWRYNDKLMWLKNNSQYTFGDRSVRNFEPIFHFTKSANHYYDATWLESFIDENNAISNGTTGIKPKLISTIDFRDGVLQSNASNTLELRKKCAEKGFYMEHSCTFPIDLPLICVLSTTRPGDTVLDLFNGTATTGEVCVLTDRKYVGYELNPQFVMASEVRLSDYELGEVA